MRSFPMAKKYGLWAGPKDPHPPGLKVFNPKMLYWVLAAFALCSLILTHTELQPMHNLSEFSTILTLMTEHHIAVKFGTLHTSMAV